MPESALPLLHSTCSGLRTVLVATQHWQSGPQRSGWLESAWPFASLNLPGPYSPLNTGSLSRLSRRGRRAAAAVEPVEFLKKGQVVNLKPCRGRPCICSQARCHGMRQSYDLGLAASLTLSCRPGVNAFFLALQRDGDARYGPSTEARSSWAWRPQQFEMLDIRIEGLFQLCCCSDVCYEHT